MTEDWFVVNVGDAEWLTSEGGEKRSSGSETTFAADFEQVGVRIHVLASASSSSREKSGASGSGDFFHSPPGTGRTFVGAGRGDRVRAEKPAALAAAAPSHSYL
jgi:hypothetical protein